MKTLNGNRLRIALQKKGRLNLPSIELLKAIGLDFDTGRSADEQLFIRCRNFDLDILFLRDDDIPEYVEDGVCDLGIVGLNVYREKQSRALILENLNYGLCQLSIAVPSAGGIDDVFSLKGKRIATTYPNLLREFLKEKGLEASIVSLSGSVEIAPILQVADAICDLVSTGNTLRVNGLRVIDTVLNSEAILIQNPRLIALKKKRLIKRLLMRIRGSLKARQTKYIMMNAPVKALPAIKAIIPGLKSPTVVPLAVPGMIAVHSVVPESVFWQVIERLKAAGASDILVMPIEKMIL